MQNACAGAKRNLILICTSDSALDQIHLEEVARVATMALVDGARRLSLGSFEWDLAGNCQMPKPVELYARPPRSWMTSWITVDPRKTEIPLYVLMMTRCRQCPACLRKRRSLWTYRSATETRSSARTWFGTLTLEPSAHYRMLCEAIAHNESRAVEWSQLTPRERFLARHRQISRELQLWLKRVRFESGAKLRYLLVAEAHATGLPHYHCLIHEPLADQSVRERTLRRQWPLGFTRFQLVKSMTEATYVCKYLSKASEARVRASKAYGRLDSMAFGIDPGLFPELLTETTDGLSPRFGDPP